MNAVHVAVRDHRVDILKLLLSKGGDVTKLTFTNQNVLHFCGQVVSDKDNPCLPVLLEYGIKKLEFNKFNQWLEQENWCGIQPKDQCKDFGKQVQRVVQEHLKKLQEKNLSFHENKK